MSAMTFNFFPTTCKRDVNKPKYKNLTSNFASQKSRMMVF